MTPDQDCQVEMNEAEQIEHLRTKYEGNSLSLKMIVRIQDPQKNLNETKEWKQNIENVKEKKLTQQQ